MDQLLSTTVDYLKKQANSIVEELLEPLDTSEKRQLNLPSRDLVNGTTEDYLNICVPLYRATITSDWLAAKAIFDKRPELVRYAVSENYVTPLHVAALAAEETSHMEHFVNNIISMMENQDLELQNAEGQTALHLAVAAGKMKMVEILVKKNANLLNIPESNENLPLHVAALFARRNIVMYLYKESLKLTDKCWTYWPRRQLLVMCVEGELFDVALTIVKDHPDLAESTAVLRRLARKPDALNKVELNFIWKIKNSIFKMTHTNMTVGSAAEKDTNDAIRLLNLFLGEFIKTNSREEVAKLIRGTPPPKNDPGILFVAAEMGNTKFVVELIRSNHDLIWQKNSDGHTIFHIAVINRHEGIHSLLYEVGDLKVMIVSLVDKDGNNMLHLVGKTSVKMRSKTYQASLLMQRELLWFKEVEKMLPPSLREKKNNDGQKPYELFSKNNEDLVSQGLKWMKDCMVVATLIVTIAFAVAFTVPGGYNQEHGLPIFIHKRKFLVFVIADTISLFSSTTSLLVFLSILTSRYSQRDFLYSLPKKLLLGLATLFISVAAMMITFSASFFVLYHNGLKWVPILISTISVIPVIVYAALQFPLLVDMFRSMYDSRYLFKPKTRMLFIPTPKALGARSVSK